MCCACFVKLYTKGDNFSVHGRVSSLQSLLSSKDALAGKTGELTRSAALDCLAALTLTFGSQLASSIPETVSLAAKHCYKCEATYNSFGGLRKPCATDVIPNVLDSKLSVSRLMEQLHQ
jgi:hypothetical protein